MESTEVIPRITVQPKPGPDGHAGPAFSASDTQTVRIETPATSRTPVGSHAPLSSLYKIIRKIGDGGMGVVYLAREIKLGRYVAVKRLKESMLKHPGILQRFLREAKAIAALNHGHIVHVYTLDEDEDGPYIAMEYVEGPRGTATPQMPAAPYTLTDQVANEGPLNLHAAIDLMIKLCQAVGYAHRCGVIHRDLKPANVLVDTHGEPKIVDFGLARRLAPDDDHLTVPGERMLSLGYGAPEQEVGVMEIDERADVYGLAAILFFTITGQNPRYFRPNQVPEIIRDLLVKALETDRHKRLPSAREFEQRLLLIKAPSSIEIPTTKVTWRCKWCNTSNPISVKYCGECGWDGTEFCPECGKETRIGIQFCGHCGADSRQYEMAGMLHQRFLKAWAGKDLESIIQHAGQIPGFHASGPAGQRLIDDIRAVRDKAEKGIARLADLRRLIPVELGQENFMLARSLIQEYNQLCGDKAFDANLQNLPNLTLELELTRARKAIHDHDWSYASHVAGEILARVKTDCAEARAIRRLAMISPWWIALRNVCLASFILFVVYLLAVPPVYRMARDREAARRNSFFDLAIMLHEGSIIRVPLERYARAWNATDVFDTHASSVTALRPIPPVNGKASSRAGLTADFKKSLYRIEAKFSRTEKAWPAEYLKALQDMLLNAQRNGEFDSWQSVKSEMDRFEATGDISESDLVREPRNLQTLQSTYVDRKSKLVIERYREIEGLCRRHLENLQGLIKTLTQQGNMAEALEASQEIQRVKSSPEYLAAAAAIAAQTPAKNK